MASAVHLLPKEALIKSGSVDHADWNYRPILGWLQKVRFRLIVSLLPQQVGRMLEVGYGSGIFMPELAARCGELHGIDVHPFSADVARTLESYGVRAQLHSGSAEAMPFPDAFFHTIVAVSSLEFVNDIDAAARDMARVLRPGGALVMVTPGRSALLDFGLRVMTGESAGKDYGNRREALMPALERCFRVERKRSLSGVYTAFLLLRKT